MITRLLPLTSTLAHILLHTIYYMRDNQSHSSMSTLKMMFFERLVMAMSELKPEMQDPATKALFDLVTGLSGKLSEDVLHEVGADVVLAKQLYEDSVKPHLNYLIGYQSLEELDMRTHRSGQEEWRSLVDRFGLQGVHKNCLLVIAKDVYSYKGSDRAKEHMQLAVVLTRNNKWILWHRYQDLEGDWATPINATEQLAAYDTFDDLCETGSGLLANGYQWSYSGEYGRAEKFLLRVAQGLHRVLRDTVFYRRNMLAELEDAANTASSRLVRVEFPLT